MKSTLLYKLTLLAVALTTSQLNGYAQTVINNDEIRVGNGTESSVTTRGNMAQPFYRNAGIWYKLTYSSYALNSAFAAGGAGEGYWNLDGHLLIDPLLANQSIDDSEFNYHSGANGSGTGLLISTGDLTIDGKTIQVEKRFELLPEKSFIKIDVKLTNASAVTAENLRVWIGTKDDWVGTTDSPLKERGNLVSGEFQILTDPAVRAKVVKVTTNNEGVLFYTATDKASGIINSCCSFGNVVGEDPATNHITHSWDGSYGFYARLNDLAQGESDEFTWYYGAGAIDELAEIASQIAQASGAVGDITCTSATFDASAGQTGTGHFVVTPAEAVAPTAQEIKEGVDYGDVVVVANGSAEVSAGSTHPFELDGLEHSTAYTVHFVVEDEPGVFSNITSEAFTSASPPEIALSTVAQNPCFEEANGSASAVITGGVAPHTTNWSSGESTPEISGKEAGAYTISVSENGGCPAAEETAVIELDDQIAPSAIAKDAVVYLDEDGNAELTVEMIDDHSFDECGIADLTITQTEFTCADTGEESEIDVFLTASDEAGNVSTALAKVTVLDTLKPRVFAQDIDVELNAEGIALVSPGMANNGSFDNCSISNFTLSKTEFNCDEIGENEVTLTATDASGNSAEASFTVRVKDDTAPVASAVENPVLYLNAEGSAVPSTDAFFENISDNCQLTSASFDVDAFSCADVGAQEINITLSDPSGNSLNVASEVMIADTISPQFNLESIELESDLNGEASLTPEMLVDHAFDACGVAEITVENELWTCAESGQETTITVTDIHGNAKSFALTVVLTDNIAPVILAEGTIVSLGSTGRSILTPEILNYQVSDNCSDVEVTLSRSRVYCDDIGMVPVTLTATDASGNSSQYTVMVEVVDDMAPVIDLPYTVYLCAGAQYDYHDFLSSSDNCDYTLIQIAGPTSDSRLTPGLYYARFKATDSSGNVTYEGCNIEVLEYPEVDLGDDLTIAPGLLVGLTAGTDPELNYEWSTGHDTPYVELYVTGNMTVSVAVSNQGGCTSYDEINISTSTATGTAEMENGSSFTLYPNPATDRINLDFELYGDLKDATVRITDIQGKVVGMEQLAHVKNGETRNINVNHLSQGMYILTISTNEMRMSTKFSRQ